MAFETAALLSSSDGDASKSLWRQRFVQIDHRKGRSNDHYLSILYLVVLLAIRGIKTAVTTIHG